MKTLAWIVGVVGIILIGISIFYFITPAHSLPHFFPGYDATLAKAHYKHGIGALLLGFACLAFTWFNTGKKSSKKE
jgi:hypothetical protein